MASKAQALAKQFEGKAQDATTTIEKLSDAEWSTVTASEQWPVGVVAHHMAMGHEAIGNIVKTVAAGQPMPHFTMDMLHEMNARHAVEHARCTKAETLALHRKNAAAAASMLRGLSDEQFGKSGTVLAGMPPMSVEQIVTAILIGHIDEHVGSIRATTGR
jgi:hypothetical protein